MLNDAASSISFQTIKNGSKLETSSFASFTGSVSESGEANLVIKLDSIDTKIDLRNVRMRFLFFETFKYPEATVRAIVDPAAIANLTQLGRIKLPVTFTLDLHGIQNELQAETVVTALAGQQVSVTSVSPITIPTSLFGLDEGVRKLEEAAGVTIVPMGSVSFNLVFDTSSELSDSETTISQTDTSDSTESVVTPQTDTVATVAASEPQPESVALETQGDFSLSECAGRFDILSQTGAILFRSGSSQLDPESEPILSAVVNIVRRCPGIKLRVAGHTDSLGSEISNLRLSESRARQVVDYLTDSGIDAARIRYIGYGESQPVAPNDTPRNRGRNRRIEFSIES